MRHWLDRDELLLVAGGPLNKQHGGDHNCAADDGFEAQYFLPRGDRDDGREDNLEGQDDRDA